MHLPFLARLSDPFLKDVSQNLESCVGHFSQRFNCHGCVMRNPCLWRSRPNAWRIMQSIMSVSMREEKTSLNITCIYRIFCSSMSYNHVSCQSQTWHTSVQYCKAIHIYFCFVSRWQSIGLATVACRFLTFPLVVKQMGNTVKMSVSLGTCCSYQRIESETRNVTCSSSLEGMDWIL